MISKFFNDNESKNIQNILSWGSVAYLAGFFTVMLHTASLGIPIIEILKPIYIWIGLPIAIVIFSIRWFWQLTSARINRIKTQFALIRDESKEVFGNSKSIEVDELVDIFINLLYTSLKIFPSVLEFMLSKIIKLLEIPIRKISKWSVQHDLRNLKVSEDIYFRNSFKMVKGLEITFRSLSEVLGAISFFVLILAIPFACFLYIYKIYPIIPQSYGGGEPLSAVLILSGEDLPTSSPEICTLFPNNTCPSQPSKTLITSTVDILYITPEQYFIQSSDQKIFALKKAIVNGIIYDEDA